MDPMQSEVRQFIKASEQLQSILARGHNLTVDEVEIVRMCAQDLLAALSQAGAENGSFAKPQ